MLLMAEMHWELPAQTVARLFEVWAIWSVNTVEAR